MEGTWHAEKRVISGSSNQRLTSLEIDNNDRDNTGNSSFKDKFESVSRKGLKFLYTNADQYLNK